MLKKCKKNYNNRETKEEYDATSFGVQQILDKKNPLIADQ